MIVNKFFYIYVLIQCKIRHKNEAANTATKSRGVMRCLLDDITIIIAMSLTICADLYSMAYLLYIRR